MLTILHQLQRTLEDIERIMQPRFRRKHVKQTVQGSGNPLATSQQQNVFPVFKLPTELRLKIYYHALITSILKQANLDYNRSDICIAIELANSRNIDISFEHSKKLISGDWDTHRVILTQAYNFFLTCREFRSEGWKIFWCNFPFAFTYNNLPRFIKSLSVPALSQVRYLKIVVSESDSRYRSIWRFDRIVDTFLAQQTFEGHFARWMERVPRYILPHLRPAFESYHRQLHGEFFDKRVGELSELRQYVLEVQLDLPRDDGINSWWANREDELNYGYRNLIWRRPFPQLLENMLQHTGLLDGAKDFEPKVQMAANGNATFESDVRDILEKARQDRMVGE